MGSAEGLVPVYRHDPGPRAMPDVTTQDAAMVHTRRCGTRQRRRPICRVVAFALPLALTACFSADHQAVHFTGKRVAPTSPTGPAISRIPAHAVKVVAVGDIACAPDDPITTISCQQAATARLGLALNPTWVLTLGDEQYETGSRRGFEGSYDASWGGLTSGAGCAANCRLIPLAAVSSRCTIRATPRPRCTARIAMAPFWRIIDHHVDLALAGHEQDYERFARMDAHAHRSPTGTASFVVGTGGKSLYGLGVPGSPGRRNTRTPSSVCCGYGSARRGFTWQFRPPARMRRA